MGVGKERTDEDEPKKKGLALLAHDFRQKQLIPIKIVSFIILASMFTNLLVISVYMLPVQFDLKVWEF